jgi:hypothetical protein
MLKKIFLNAFRTALLIVLGFVVYDINLKVIKQLQILYPDITLYHFTLLKLLKFLFIFILDFAILYIYAYWFKISI